MLDQYQIDDVLEAERPPEKSAPTPASQRAIPMPGEQVLNAAITFNADAESFIHQWMETEFAECLDKHRHFTETAVTNPTASDWKTLFIGVQLSVLSGDTEPQQLEKMDAWLKACALPQALALRSVIAFFSHQPRLAIDFYNDSCNADSNEGDAGFVGLPAMVYALSQVQQATQSLSTDHAGGFSSADFKQLQLLVTRLNTFSRDYQKTFAGDAFIPVLRVLTDFVRVICGQREVGDTIWLGGQHIDASPWLDLFLGLARHWLGEKPDEQQISRLVSHVDRASEIGLHWFVDEGLTLLSAQGLQRDASEYQPQIRSTGWLLTVYKKQSDWSGTLDSLTLTVNRHSRALNQAAKGVSNRRISWWVDAAGSKLLVEPREQRQSKKGQWSRGKHFPLKLLLDECGTLDFLCDHDLKICAHLRNQLQLNHALHFERSFGFSSAESLDLIINHPRLYRGDIDDEEEQAVRLSIRARQSTLQVVEDKSLQEINISMDPYPSSEIKSASDFTCEWEENNILAIHRYSEGQLDIARSLTFSGLSVPADASEPVLESLRAMAALVEIHSEINAVDSDTVIASTRLAFHLRPLEHGLDIEGRLYPLGEAGPCVIPGVGKSNLYAMVSGRPCNTIRDLDAEASHAREIVNQLPLPNGGAGWQWALQDAEQALEVLAVLQDLEDKVTLLWPAGECIALSREIDSERLAIHFQSQRGGIGVAGDLKIEEGGGDTPLFSHGGAAELCPFESKKINLKKLLASLDSAQGRFLRLDDGKILQLSKRLQMQLEALNAVSDDGVAHQLALPMLEEVSRGMVLRSDDSWDEQLEKLREAESLMPNPPATLKAELRDYQLHGFRWMARLAHWGAGACLADDMGLGKTMQSLSLILMRAAGGPALVAAPTSVCGNWLAEAEKFAPSLQLRWLGDKNRSRLLRDAGPNDLFVCSYGVLQNEIEMLQEIQWHTIIADEAQSFKNPGTRRSQAMMSLRGDFRVIATGTPIENHLGELWNLFRFINPGLLGSGQNFKERYAVPIEQHEDDMARHRLKTLIRPFILRRLKRDVLTELPERTEITHMIEFNEAESNFYEGLRKQALQRISELSGLDSEQRFRVLAEITTLRQASCHPELVTDTPPCGSAKLRAFAEIVDELRHNGHRCLVFSQFVGHLTLIRKHLDANRISYQYLDGSTSVKKRKQAVDDFQGGEGELFLISLKAGGSGLNLTAADYVIHMDPWWNPAVEDQASDRAYRMGQKRPVTIYRMVVKNTIEEKIVKLHAQKRDLANALLEGTDGGTKLSVEELVELIDDEAVDEGEGQ